MKSTDEMIAVMEASKTKIIEFSKPGETEWLSCLSPPTWNWMQYDYRVKPQEPRRMFGLENNKRPLVAAYPELSTAMRNFDECSMLPNFATKIEFIELTPEIRERLGL